jgi:predicted transport protein
MGDIRVFSMDGPRAEELKGSSVELEKTLQSYIEQNLDSLLGIAFLASEYGTGKTHGGRIDTLGLDENGFPVIIEYKRTLNENVINQGLYYLDWLLDHKGEYELLVLKKLGNEWADRIDWTSPRLLCIAGDYTKYDTHAVSQINRNIELIRYRKFDRHLLLLELVNVTTIAQTPPDTGGQKSTKLAVGKSTVSEILAQCDPAVRNRYEQLRAFMEALGDDVIVSVLKHYIAFKRSRNFACVLFVPTSKIILVYVKTELSPELIEEGFARDVTNIGHYGTGNLEILIRTDEDLKRAEPLILRSFEGR